MNNRSQGRMQRTGGVASHETEVTSCQPTLPKTVVRALVTHDDPVRKIF